MKPGENAESVSNICSLKRSMKGTPMIFIRVQISERCLFALVRKLVYYLSGNFCRILIHFCAQVYLAKFDFFKRGKEKVDLRSDKA